MKSYSVHFGFSQHFDFTAQQAFAWCTDYAPGDLNLMGERGTRSVRRINEDTFVLTDEYVREEGNVIKEKAVRIYPERLCWTNTRISKNGMLSQFLYQIVPEKGGSRLEFTGAQIFDGRRPTPKKLAAIAKQLTKEDSASWRNLAKAMAEDLTQPRRR